MSLDPKIIATSVSLTEEALFARQTEASTTAKDPRIDPIQYQVSIPPIDTTTFPCPSTYIPRGYTIPSQDGGAGLVWSSLTNNDLDTTDAFSFVQSLFPSKSHPLQQPSLERTLAMLHNVNYSTNILKSYAAAPLVKFHNYVPGEYASGPSRKHNKDKITSKTGDTSQLQQDADHLQPKAAEASDAQMNSGSENVTTPSQSKTAPNMTSSSGMKSYQQSMQQHHLGLTAIAPFTTTQNPETLSSCSSNIPHISTPHPSSAASLAHDHYAYIHSLKNPDTPVLEKDHRNPPQSGGGPSSTAAEEIGGAGAPTTTAPLVSDMIPQLANEIQSNQPLLTTQLSSWGVTPLTVPVASDDDDDDDDEYLDDGIGNSKDGFLVHNTPPAAAPLQPSVVPSSVTDHLPEKSSRHRYGTYAYDGVDISQLPYHALLQLPTFPDRLPWVFNNLYPTVLEHHRREVMSAKIEDAIAIVTAANPHNTQTSPEAEADAEVGVVKASPEPTTAPAAVEGSAVTQDTDSKSLAVTMTDMNLHTSTSKTESISDLQTNINTVLQNTTSPSPSSSNGVISHGGIDLDADAIQSALDKMATLENSVFKSHLSMKQFPVLPKDCVIRDVVPITPEMYLQAKQALSLASSSRATDIKDHQHSTPLSSLSVEPSVSSPEDDNAHDAHPEQHEQHMSLPTLAPGSKLHIRSSFDELASAMDDAPDGNTNDNQSTTLPREKLVVYEGLETLLCRLSTHPQDECSKAVIPPDYLLTGVTSTTIPEQFTAPEHITLLPRSKTISNASPSELKSLTALSQTDCLLSFPQLEAFEALRKSAIESRIHMWHTTIHRILSPELYDAFGTTSLPAVPLADPALHTIHQSLLFSESSSTATGLKDGDDTPPSTVCDPKGISLQHLTDIVRDRSTMARTSGFYIEQDELIDGVQLEPPQLGTPTATTTASESAPSGHRSSSNRSSSYDDDMQDDHDSIEADDEDEDGAESYDDDDDDESATDHDKPREPRGRQGEHVKATADTAGGHDREHSLLKPVLSPRSTLTPASDDQNEPAVPVPPSSTSTDAASVQTPSNGGAVESNSIAATITPALDIDVDMTDATTHLNTATATSTGFQSHINDHASDIDENEKSDSRVAINDILILRHLLVRALTWQRRYQHSIRCKDGWSMDELISFEKEADEWLPYITFPELNKVRELAALYRIWKHNIHILLNRAVRQPNNFFHSGAPCRLLPLDATDDEIKAAYFPVRLTMKQDEEDLALTHDTGVDQVNDLSLGDHMGDHRGNGTKSRPGKPPGSVNRRLANSYVRSSNSSSSSSTRLHVKSIEPLNMMGVRPSCKFLPIQLVIFLRQCDRFFPMLFLPEAKIFRDALQFRKRLLHIIYRRTPGIPRRLLLDLDPSANVDLDTVLSPSISSLASDVLLNTDLDNVMDYKRYCQYLRGLREKKMNANAITNNSEMSTQTLTHEASIASHTATASTSTPATAGDMHDRDTTHSQALTEATVTTTDDKDASRYCPVSSFAEMPSLILLRAMQQADTITEPTIADINNIRYDITGTTVPVEPPLHYHQACYLLKLANDHLSFLHVPELRYIELAIRVAEDWVSMALDLLRDSSSDAFFDRIESHLGYRHYLQVHVSEISLITRTFETRRWAMDVAHLKARSRQDGRHGLTVAQVTNLLDTADQIPIDKNDPTYIELYEAHQLGVKYEEESVRLLKNKKQPLSVWRELQQNIVMSGLEIDSLSDVNQVIDNTLQWFRDARELLTLPENTQNVMLVYHSPIHQMYLQQSLQQQQQYQQLQQQQQQHLVNPNHQVSSGSRREPSQRRQRNRRNSPVVSPELPPQMDTMPVIAANYNSPHEMGYEQFKEHMERARTPLVAMDHHQHHHQQLGEDMSTIPHNMSDDNAIGQTHNAGLLASEMTPMNPSTMSDISLDTEPSSRGDGVVDQHRTLLQGQTSTHHAQKETKTTSIDLHFVTPISKFPPPAVLYNLSPIQIQPGDPTYHLEQYQGEDLSIDFPAALAMGVPPTIIQSMGEFLFPLQHQQPQQQPQAPTLTSEGDHTPSTEHPDRQRSSQPTAMPHHINFNDVERICARLDSPHIALIPNASPEVVWLRRLRKVGREWLEVVGSAINTLDYSQLSMTSVEQLPYSTLLSMIDERRRALHALVFMLSAYNNPHKAYDDFSFDIDKNTIQIKQEHDTFKQQWTAQQQVRVEEYKADRRRAARIARRRGLPDSIRHGESTPSSPSSSSEPDESIIEMPYKHSFFVEPPQQTITLDSGELLSPDGEIWSPNPVLETLPMLGLLHIDMVWLVAQKLSEIEHILRLGWASLLGPRQLTLPLLAHILMFLRRSGIRYEDNRGNYLEPMYSLTMRLITAESWNQMAAGLFLNTAPQQPVEELPPRASQSGRLSSKKSKKGRTSTGSRRDSDSMMDEFDMPLGTPSSFGLAGGSMSVEFDPMNSMNMEPTPLSAFANDENAWQQDNKPTVEQALFVLRQLRGHPDSVVYNDHQMPIMCACDPQVAGSDLAIAIEQIVNNLRLDLPTLLRQAQNLVYCNCLTDIAEHAVHRLQPCEHAAYSLCSYQLFPFLTALASGESISHQQLKDALAPAWTSLGTPAHKPLRAVKSRSVGGLVDEISSRSGTSIVALANASQHAHTSSNSIDSSLGGGSDMAHEHSSTHSPRNANHTTTTTTTETESNQSDSIEAMIASHLDPSRRRIQLTLLDVVADSLREEEEDIYMSLQHDVDFTAFLDAYKNSLNVVGAHTESNDPLACYAGLSDDAAMMLSMYKAYVQPGEPIRNDDDIRRILSFLLQRRRMKTSFLETKKTRRQSRRRRLHMRSLHGDDNDDEHGLHSPYSLYNDGGDNAPDNPHEYLSTNIVTRSTRHSMIHYMDFDPMSAAMNQHGVHGHSAGRLLASHFTYETELHWLYQYYADLEESSQEVAIRLQLYFLIGSVADYLECGLTDRQPGVFLQLDSKTVAQDLLEYHPSGTQTKADDHDETHPHTHPDVKSNTDTVPPPSAESTDDSGNQAEDAQQEPASTSTQIPNTSTSTSESATTTPAAAANAMKPPLIPAPPRTAEDPKTTPHLTHKGEGTSSSSMHATTPRIHPTPIHTSASPFLVPTTVLTPLTSSTQPRLSRPTSSLAPADTASVAMDDDTTLVSQSTHVGLSTPYHAPVSIMDISAPLTFIWETTPVLRKSHKALTRAIKQCLWIHNIPLGIRLRKVHLPYASYLLRAVREVKEVRTQLVLSLSHTVQASSKAAAAQIALGDGAVAGASTGLVVPGQETAGQVMSPILSNTVASLIDAAPVQLDTGISPVGQDSAPVADPTQQPPSGEGDMADVTATETKTKIEGEPSEAVPALDVDQISTKQEQQQQQQQQGDVGTTVTPDDPSTSPHPSTSNEALTDQPTQAPSPTTLVEQIHQTALTGGPISEEQVAFVLRQTDENIKLTAHRLGISEAEVAQQLILEQLQQQQLQLAHQMVPIETTRESSDQSLKEILKLAMGLDLSIPEVSLLEQKYWPRLWVMHVRDALNVFSRSSITTLASLVNDARMRIRCNQVDKFIEAEDIRQSVLEVITRRRGQLCAMYLGQIAATDPRFQVDGVNSEILLAIAEGKVVERKIAYDQLLQNASRAVNVLLLDHIRQREAIRKTLTAQRSTMTHINSIIATLKTDQQQEIDDLKQSFQRYAEELQLEIVQLETEVILLTQQVLQSAAQDDNTAATVAAADADGMAIHEQNNLMTAPLVVNDEQLSTTTSQDGTTQQPHEQSTDDQGLAVSQGKLQSSTEEELAQPILESASTPTQPASTTGDNAETQKQQQQEGDEAQATTTTMGDDVASQTQTGSSAMDAEAGIVVDTSITTPAPGPSFSEQPTAAQTSDLVDMKDEEPTQPVEAALEPQQDTGDKMERLEEVAVKTEAALEDAAVSRVVDSTSDTTNTSAVSVKAESTTEIQQTTGDDLKSSSDDHAGDAGQADKPSQISGETKMSDAQQATPAAAVVDTSFIPASHAESLPITPPYFPFPTHLFPEAMETPMDILVTLPSHSIDDLHPLDLWRLVTSPDLYKLPLDTLHGIMSNCDRLIPQGYCLSAAALPSSWLLDPVNPQDFASVYRFLINDCEQLILLYAEWGRLARAFIAHVLGPANEKIIFGTPIPIELEVDVARPSVAPDWQNLIALFSGLLANCSDEVALEVSTPLVTMVGVSPAEVMHIQSQDIPLAQQQLLLSSLKLSQAWAPPGCGIPHIENPQSILMQQQQQQQQHQHHHQQSKSQKSNRGRQRRQQNQPSSHPRERERERDSRDIIELDDAQLTAQLLLPDLLDEFSDANSPLIELSSINAGVVLGHNNGELATATPAPVPSTAASTGLPQRADFSHLYSQLQETPQRPPPMSKTASTPSQYDETNTMGDGDLPTTAVPPPQTIDGAINEKQEHEAALPGLEPAPITTMVTETGEVMIINPSMDDNAPLEVSTDTMTPLSTKPHLNALYASQKVTELMKRRRLLPPTLHIPSITVQECGKLTVASPVTCPSPQPPPQHHCSCGIYTGPYLLKTYGERAYQLGLATCTHNNPQILYCYCKLIHEESESMVECESCHDWFHTLCLGITKTDLKRTSSFVCAECSQSRSRLYPFRTRISTRRLKMNLPTLADIHNILEFVSIYISTPEADTLRALMNLSMDWSARAESLLTIPIGEQLATEDNPLLRHLVVNSIEYPEDIESFINDMNTVNDDLIQAFNDIPPDIFQNLISSLGLQLCRIDGEPPDVKALKAQRDNPIGQFIIHLQTFFTHVPIDIISHLKMRTETLQQMYRESLAIQSVLPIRVPLEARIQCMLRIEQAIDILRLIHHEYCPDETTFLMAAPQVMLSEITAPHELLSGTDPNMVVPHPSFIPPPLEAKWSVDDITRLHNEIEGMLAQDHLQDLHQLLLLVQPLFGSLLQRIDMWRSNTMIAFQEATRVETLIELRHEYKQHFWFLITPLISDITYRISRVYSWGIAEYEALKLKKPWQQLVRVIADRYQQCHRTYSAYTVKIEMEVARAEWWVAKYDRLIVTKQPSSAFELLYQEAIQQPRILLDTRELRACDDRRECYCLCQRAFTEGEEMVGCDSCNDWFHLHCAAITGPLPENESYICPRCCQIRGIPYKYGTIKDFHTTQPYRYQPTPQFLVSLGVPAHHRAVANEEPPKPCDYTITAAPWNYSRMFELIMGCPTYCCTTLQRQQAHEVGADGVWAGAGHLAAQSDQAEHMAQPTSFHVGGGVLNAHPASEYPAHLNHPVDSFDAPLGGVNNRSKRKQLQTIEDHYVYEMPNENNHPPLATRYAKKPRVNHHDGGDDGDTGANMFIQMNGNDIVMASPHPHPHPYHIQQQQQHQQQQQPHHLFPPHVVSYAEDHSQGAGLTDVAQQQQHHQQQLQLQMQMQMQMQGHPNHQYEPSHAEGLHQHEGGDVMSPSLYPHRGDYSEYQAHHHHQQQLLQQQQHQQQQQQQQMQTAESQVPMISIRFGPTNTINNELINPNAMHDYRVTWDQFAHLHQLGLVGPLLPNGTCQCAEEVDTSLIIYTAHAAIAASPEDLAVLDQQVALIIQFVRSNTLVIPGVTNPQRYGAASPHHQDGHAGSTSGGAAFNPLSTVDEHEAAKIYATVLYKQLCDSLDPENAQTLHELLTKYINNPVDVSLQEQITESVKSICGERVLEESLAQVNRFFEQEVQLHHARTTVQAQLEAISKHMTHHIEPDHHLHDGQQQQQQHSHGMEKNDENPSEVQLTDYQAHPQQDDIQVNPPVTAEHSHVDQQPQQQPSLPPPETQPPLEAAPNTQRDGQLDAHIPDHAVDTVMGDHPMPSQPLPPPPTESLEVPLQPQEMMTDHVEQNDASTPSEATTPQERGENLHILQLQHLNPLAIAPYQAQETAPLEPEAQIDQAPVNIDENQHHVPAPALPTPDHAVPSVQSESTINHPTAVHPDQSSQLSPTPSSSIDTTTIDSHQQQIEKEDIPNIVTSEDTPTQLSVPHEPAQGSSAVDAPKAVAVDQSHQVSQPPLPPPSVPTPDAIDITLSTDQMQDLPQTMVDDTQVATTHITPTTTTTSSSPQIPHTIGSGEPSTPEATLASGQVPINLNSNATTSSSVVQLPPPQPQRQEEEHIPNPSIPVAPQEDSQQPS